MSGAFDGIEGHGLAKMTLQRAVSDGRVAHAYLFAGPEGVGKKLAAVAFAKALNCAAGGAAGCECSACSRIDGRVYPDVSLFEYEDKRVITVDNVRDEIERGIFLKPFESTYKIFIVDGAERMNASAQNAFLKTLEEPPPRSVIVLITGLPSMIMPTIRSRCRTVAFGKLDGATAREKLRERGDLSDGDLELAVRMADGSPGKALKIKPERIAEAKETVKSLAALEPDDFQAVCGLVESVLGKAGGNATQRAAAERFADSVSLWIRDLVSASSGGGEPVYQTLGETSARFARRRSADSLVEKAAALEDAAAGIKLGNLNCKLTLENLAIKIAGI